MVNYQNGKIYKIIDNTNGNLYVGSTCEPNLSRRLSKHVSRYRQYLESTKNNRVCTFSSFKILENGDNDIILFELFSCNTKDELHSRERYYIELLGEVCVNKNIPTRTKPEYREANKQIILQKRKEHYKNNIEKVKEQSREHYLDNKDKYYETRKKYREENKETINQYRINNIERIKENSKMYFQNNRDKFKEYRNQVVICSCGKSYKKGDKNHHDRTKYHLSSILKGV